jgi:thiol-disulfide isomerase/thioredoxin
MKNIFLLITLLLLCISSCKTLKCASEISPDTKPASTPVTSVSPPANEFSDPQTWLLGYFDPARLKSEPYSEWYIKGYDEYEFNPEGLNKLLELNRDNLSVKVVMGTWCSDSRKQIPRLMRILDIWQFPVTGLTFIGVDDKKHSPVDELSSLNIQRVPTIIIYKNNIEAGRIIESPVTSLEQDMVNIISGVNNNK